MAARHGITKRSAKPGGLYHFYLAAIRAAGASEFCSEPSCYGFVGLGHSCPDWRALGLPVFSAPAAVLTLEGGLEEEPVSDMTTEERAAFVDEHDAQLAEVA